MTNHYYTPCTTKLLGGILVSLRLSIRLSIRPSVSLTSCVGSCYQTETANQWVCGTGSWWVVLTLLYSQLVHSTLEWFWVSRRIFIHSHHNTFVFFLKTSVRPTSRVRSVSPTILVGSISYLHILSSNFRRCITCKASCKIAKFEFLAITSMDNHGVYLRTQAF